MTTGSVAIGVLLIGILQLIPDEDDPRAIVTRLMEAVPRGSWLAIFHPASDILADQKSEAARQLVPAWAAGAQGRPARCDESG